MDDRWYYAEASDRSYGPMSLEELGRVLGTKANAVDFLVWCPGMADWGKAGDQFALRRYFQPPPIRVYPGVDPELRPTRADESDSSVHPWRRYFARMLDVYVFLLFFFFFLGIAFPRLFEGSDKSLNALYGIFGLGAYAIFEGFCMNVFGSSLGKRLYGITTIRTNGDDFPLSVSFKRSFAVWVRGLGFGIPIAAFFTLLVAHRTLTREKQTSWDRDFLCSTSHTKLSALRWFLIVVVWLFLLSVYVFLNAIGDGKL
jgi:hypothetical protein